MSKLPLNWPPKNNPLERDTAFLAIDHYSKCGQNKMSWICLLAKPSHRLKQPVVAQQPDAASALISARTGFLFDLHADGFLKRSPSSSANWRDKFTRRALTLPSPRKHTKQSLMKASEDIGFVNNVDVIKSQLLILWCIFLFLSNTTKKKSHLASLQKYNCNPIFSLNKTNLNEASFSKKHVL